ncbi:hypothetical protein G6514_006692, partial [Epicoccum nigrum]
MRKGSAFQPDEGEENEAWEDENITGTIADLQAGHTSHVAGMIYARGIMEMAGAVADRRLQFRTSSTDWHRFLGFQMDSEDGKPKKRKRAPFECEAEQSRASRWARLRRMDVDGQLRQTIGKKAQFRGVQREAIQAIVAGERQV